MTTVTFPIEDIQEMLTSLYNHPKFKIAIASIGGFWIFKSVVLALWRRYKFNRKIAARLEMAGRRKKEVQRQCAGVTNSRSIVDLPVHELVGGMKSGKLKVVDVLHAFQKEALDVNDRLNCVTEPVPEAEALARRMDANPTKEGLLYGIPISVKEHIGLEGYDFTGGITQLLNKVAREDADIVKVFKRHGAIPFMRGNIPQTMMSYSCHNPIYGTTVNPHDHTRTPGGSSGGDAAIVGGGACILAIGSDMGGSIRVPANHCGIYGLKPTVGRICTKGIMAPMKGGPIRGVTGPLTRDMETLLLVSRAILTPILSEVDPSLPPVHFDEKLLTSTSRLRIGYYTYDGVVQCLPSSARAVMEAKLALEKLGHEVVHFDFPTLMGRGFPNLECYTALATADRAKPMRNLLGHDKPVPAIKMLVTFMAMPAWFNKLLGSFVSLLDKSTGDIIKATAGKRSVYEFNLATAHFLEWQEEFMSTWRKERLDAVICPAWPCPVPTTDQAEYLLGAGTYTQMYNALNYPAGVLPVTKVTKEDIRKTFDGKSFKPDSYLSKEIMKCAKDSEGLPTGVQCVALPFKEEICLRVMSELDKALH